MIQRIQEAVRFIKSRTTVSPQIGIILGTGLGKFADQIEIDSVIPYQEIPHFPLSTVPSHKGNLITGFVGKQPVAALQGRFHYYEGYSPEQIVFPLRALGFLGINTVIISNAAGGLNPQFKPGQIVFVKDHINLLPISPLRGTHSKELGLQFPDMTNTYDRALIRLAEEVTKILSIPFQTGIYVAVPGPQLETPSELKYLRTIGADLVGMSTIPEVIAAKQMSMQIMVISIVTNQCLSRITPKETTIEEVIKIAAETEPSMSKIVKELINRMDKSPVRNTNH